MPITEPATATMMTKYIKRKGAVTAAHSSNSSPSWAGAAQSGSSATKCSIVEAVAHMDEIELSDAHVACPAEHAVEMGMGRMRIAGQAVGDPHVDVFIKRSHIVS